MSQDFSRQSKEITLGFHVEVAADQNFPYQAEPREDGDWGFWRVSVFLPLSGLPLRALSSNGCKQSPVNHTPTAPSYRGE